MIPERDDRALSEAVALAGAPETDSGYFDSLLDAGSEATGSAQHRNGAAAGKEDGADPEWTPPTPFYEQDVPTFPTAALPNWQQEFVEAEATATQTPPDLAGVLVLAATAAACAKKVDAHVRDGWSEPLNVYGAIALPPGNRKTAVFNDVTAPLAQFEAAETARLAPDIAEEEA